MMITHRPSGTPEENARTATAVMLANMLDAVITSQDPKFGVVLEALGVLLAARAKDFEHARKMGRDLMIAIDAGFTAKERANV